MGIEMKKIRNGTETGTEIEIRNGINTSFEKLKSRVVKICTFLCFFVDVVDVIRNRNNISLNKCQKRPESKHKNC